MEDQKGYFQTTPEERQQGKLGEFGWRGSVIELLFDVESVLSSVSVLHSYSRS